jgi:hypothetical protein
VSFTRLPHETKEWTLNLKLCYSQNLANQMTVLQISKEVIFLGSVIKKRRKKMRKHKHRKLLAKTRHQRKKK